MCWILNIAIFCICSVLYYNTLDELDGCLVRKIRRRCWMKIVGIIFLYGIAILILYKAFGVNDNNWMDYMATGRI
jgi:quinol-cytochrome oxidoreductase complex cytochrome b subunit